MPFIPNSSSLTFHVCVAQITVKRLRNTLRTIPGADLEAFQAQGTKLFFILGK